MRLKPLEWHQYVMFYVLAVGSITSFGLWSVCSLLAFFIICHVAEAKP